MDRRSIQEWLRAASRTELPENLSARIIRAVEGREVFRRYRDSTVFGVLSVAAAYGLVLAFGEFRAELAETGFIRFVSLVVSDFSVLPLMWKEFLLSLAESFPVLGTTLLFAGIAWFAVSIRLLVRSAVWPHKKSSVVMM